MRVAARQFENTFLVVGLLIFSGAFIPLLRGDESSLVDGDPIQRILFAIIYAFTLLLVLGSFRRFMIFSTKNNVLVLFLLLIALSVFWSSTPAVSLRRTVAILGSTLFGIYFVYRRSLASQLQLLCIVFNIIIVTSTLFSLFLPEYGIMSGRHAGSWRGVFGHKNALGQAMVMGIAVLMVYNNISRKYRRLRWFLIVLAFVNLVRADSVTAIILSVGIVVFIYLLQIINQDQRIVPVIGSTLTLAMTIGGILIIMRLEEIVTMLGRSITLTGRTDLWGAALEMIAKRPFGGYGYGGFWRGANEPSLTLWQKTAWVSVPPHAHNGALDIALDLGLLGLALFVVLYLVAAMRSGKVLLETSLLGRQWPLTYVVLLLITNLTESNVIRTNDLNWILFAGIATWLANRHPIRVWSRRQARTAPSENAYVL